MGCKDDQGVYDANGGLYNQKLQVMAEEMHRRRFQEWEVRFVYLQDTPSLSLSLSRTKTLLTILLRGDSLVP